MGARQRFRAWRTRRPFVGGLLLVLAGVEMFFSTQLDLGNIRVQMGIEGFQATLIPIVLVMLGLLVLAMPVHHVFYGVIALVVAVYSIVGVNLGGFFVGMLLGAVGGVLAVAWLAPVPAPQPEIGGIPPRARLEAADAPPETALAESAESEAAGEVGATRPFARSRR